MASTSIASQSYASRIENFAKNDAAKALLETMERKQTNLCVSVDVTKKQDLLDVVQAVSGVVALVKVRRVLRRKSHLLMCDMLMACSFDFDAFFRLTLTLWKISIRI